MDKGKNLHPFKRTKDDNYHTEVSQMHKDQPSGRPITFITLQVQMKTFLTRGNPVDQGKKFTSI